LLLNEHLKSRSKTNKYFCVAERDKGIRRNLIMQEVRADQKNKKRKIQHVDILKQESLVPVTLKEISPVDFFNKITVNVT